MTPLGAAPLAGRQVPFNSAFQATLRVGYPEHPHAPVLRCNRSPEGATALRGKVASIEGRASRASREVSLVTLLDSSTFLLYMDNMEIVEVCPLEGFRLFLKFNDGISGTVDLSSFAGKGVFASWLQDGCFNQVRITESGALEWPGELDLCPDSLYMRLTGKSPEDLFSAISRNLVHA